MKSHLIIIGLLSLINYSVSAQDFTTKIKQTAERYAEALISQDVRAEVQYRYPRYIEASGGRDSLIKDIQNDYKSTFAYIKLMTVTIGEPGQVIKYGSQLYSIVPDTFAVEYLMQKPKQIIKTRSSLIAISDDSGQNWFFVRYNDFGWLKSVLPDADKLNIPNPVTLSITDLRGSHDSYSEPDTGIRTITINLSADTSKPSKLLYDKATKEYSVNFGKDSIQKPTGKAQTIRKYYLGRRALALVIITHNQEFLADTNSFKLIKSEWIKLSIIGAYMANPNDILKYGPNAINGVNRYIIDDKKYPKIYSKVAKGMKYIGPFDTNILDAN